MHSSTMLFVLVCVAAVVSSVFSAPATPKCDFDFEVFRCMFTTGFKIGSGDYYSKYAHFMESDEVIDSMCSELLPLNQCIAEAAERCITKAKPFILVHRERSDSLEKLCDSKSSLRREYLKYAKCLNTNKAQYEKTCFVNLPVPDEKPSEEDCEKYSTTISSCESKVDKACGPGAVAMVGELFKASKNFFTALCK